MSKKIVVIATVVLAIIISVGSFFTWKHFYKKSPEYAIKQFSAAVEMRDVNEALNFIDMDSLTDYIAPKLIEIQKIRGTKENDLSSYTSLNNEYISDRESIINTFKNMIKNEFSQIVNRVNTDTKVINDFVTMNPTEIIVKVKNNFAIITSKKDGKEICKMKNSKYKGWRIVQYNFDQSELSKNIMAMPQQPLPPDPAPVPDFAPMSSVRTSPEESQ
ncbi:MAG: hypothetical protein PHG20_05120 [Geobacteraceae bacterium]|nr:hypothetical protein [Geobacteraceae bacterium]